MTVARASFEDYELAKILFGKHDENAKLIERSVDVRVSVRGNTITIQGGALEVKLAKRIFQELYEVLEKGYPVYPADVDYAIRILSEKSSAKLKELFLDKVGIKVNKRVITPKSLGQKEYVDAIRRFDIVFSIGPAGTGKTYLAMALGVSLLMKKEFGRIILTRPAVEAGEKLGFLPGDLYEKVNPYLRPLYDALHDMMDFDHAMRLLQRGEIEVAPLAFMRGRTLNDSFVILDEAQNSTSEQMKMFLTRLGYGSKAVITGDITQVDLPDGTLSGLIEARAILSGITGIRFCYFSEKDVVRHPLVRDIIKAYDLSGQTKNHGPRSLPKEFNHDSQLQTKQ
ncbi:MAG: PhoH family protein [Deltaproteobacteria bacterium]|nr:PhoH family protein [Deltaproteobacteria bacterium]MBW2306363.1 PhoH family protein [Deltaproteobacteria bacterium]